MTTPAPISVEAYEAMGPWHEADRDTPDQDLLAYIASVVDLLQPVEDLIRDTPEGPGWSVLVDVERTPEDALAWLGQFIGVRVDARLDDESKRIRLREASGWARGTTGAIAGAARQWLTGRRQVIIEERFGSPYRLRVRTFASETTDPVSINAALQAAKPAGLVLIYEVATGATYAEIDAAAGTYADNDVAFGKYQDQTLYVPPE